jgi:hypothetical protein
MAWKATAQPPVRKQRGKWVVRVDGIDAVTASTRGVEVPAHSNRYRGRRWSGRGRGVQECRCRG